LCAQKPIRQAKNIVSSHRGLYHLAAQAVRWRGEVLTNRGPPWPTGRRVDESNQSTLWDDRWEDTKNDRGHFSPPPVAGQDTKNDRGHFSLPQVAGRIAINLGSGISWPMHWRCIGDVVFIGSPLSGIILVVSCKWFTIQL